MTPKRAYLRLCIVGTLLPLWQFFPFIRQHGLNMRLFVEQLFSTPVSAFFAMDVLVSAIVVCVMVSVEGRRAGMTRLWAPVLSVFVVGVSLGLPLFLYMREAQRATSARAPVEARSSVRLKIDE